MGRMTHKLMLAAFILLDGCATGPSLQESQASVPRVPVDRGRIYFYRTNSPFGSAIQPSVRLDGLVVGDAVPGGVFFCNVVPGRYTASVESEVEKSVDVDVAAGESAYVKMDWGMGWLFARIQLEMPPADIGARETAEASLIKAKCQSNDVSSHT